MDSLWGTEFNIQSTKQVAKKIKSKIDNKKSAEISTVKTIKSKKLSIDDRLALVNSEVNRILGRYKEQTLVIKTKEVLIDYIDNAIANGIIAIDTETNNSLEPVTCKLMGPCIYTPGQLSAYIPVNHIDKNTGERLPWQLTEEDIHEQFQRLISSTKIIMHNGKFDYQVLKCTCNLELPIYWDTIIGARLLDENEWSYGLKQQYIAKIDPSIEKYSIDHLFENIEYSIVDPEIFALYAATDSLMTYRLYEWQALKFNLPENKNLKSLLFNVEMPIVPVTAEMELTGICIDVEYAKRLKKKYHTSLDAVEEQINQELITLKDKIDKWRVTSDATYKPPKNGRDGSVSFGKSKSEQLEDPINTASPTQLAILLYDILQVGVIDKKSPRGTGEDILKKINLPLCKLILQKRGLLKLINTYIDKVIDLHDASVDGRVRTHFNQLGAGTGRFSSSDPINLQNIPSHENSIRMMFTAAPGCKLVGGDFSQQEPRILSQFSGDESMINAYKEGKDLYATMATRVYHNTYEDNKEFYPDGSMNPEGKKRRSNMKGLLLGIMYGRGIKSIAEQIKTHSGEITQEDISQAQQIQDSFFNAFPKVKQWINQTQKEAQQNGFVEDLWGRRRRLPDIQLDPYEVKLTVKNIEFNPLLNSSGDSGINQTVDTYIQKLKHCRDRREIERIKKECIADNVQIKDNTAFIAQAQRQCVNARIQGSAASMSKRAMAIVASDKYMKDLGFKLLIAVHDELIGECPEQNAEEVKNRLSELMISSALPQCIVPMKCDTDIFNSWYEDVYSADRKQEYHTLLQEGFTPQQAFDKILLDRPECDESQLKRFLFNT